MNGPAALARYPDLGERTYETLKQEILTGRLAPGAELVIVDLAQLLAVSRSPVKDALERLCGEELAVQVPGKGYFVSQVDEKQLDHLLDARLLVEVAAIERGIHLIEEDELVAMRKLVDEMQGLVDAQGRYVDFPEFMKRDQAFHSLLVATSKNPYLVRFHRTLNFHVFQARMHFAAQLADRRAVLGVQEHKAILNAFETRNPSDLRAAVEQHIRKSMASFGVVSPA